MRLQIFVYAVVAWLVCLPLGCVGRVYDQDGPKVLPNSISLRNRWKASGDLTKPALAIDGNIATAAVTAHNPYDNAAITIDLGKACVFNLIVVDHGSSEFGYCRKVTAYVSVDNRRFDPVYVGSGSRRFTNICLMKPALARYVRLQATVPGTRPWSVAEVYVK